MRRRLPLRRRVQHPPDLREREEPATGLVGLGHGRGRSSQAWIVAATQGPTARSSVSDRPASASVGGLLGPVSGGAGRASEGAAAMIGLLLAGAPQELGQHAVGQGHVVGGSSRRRS